MTIANIDINGHTYTDAMWRADWEGTISAIANDIASAVAGAALVGGTLHKTISGDTTLTTPECQNRVFVFSGTLGGDVTVAFDSSFLGLATVQNNTNHTIYMALSGGSASTPVPSTGTALVYCDGVGVYNTTGITKTSTGVSIAGDLAVSGNLDVAGSTHVTSNLTVVGEIQGYTVTVVSTISSTGDLTVSGNLTVTGNIHGGDYAVFAGSITTSRVQSLGDIVAEAGTLTTFSTTGEARMYLSTEAGNSQWIEFETAGIGRWLLGKSNDAETGSNVGSNFSIVTMTDAGETPGLLIPFMIYRNTSHVRMNMLPTLSEIVDTEGSGILWKDGDGIVHVT